jgi:hypothetical protein
MVNRATPYFTINSRPIYIGNNGEFYYTIRSTGPLKYRLRNYHEIYTKASNRMHNLRLMGTIANVKRSGRFPGAATKIQARWRGYKTRQNIRYPKPNNFNMNKILFMEKRNNKSGRKYNATTRRSYTGLENIRRLFN